MDAIVELEFEDWRAFKADFLVRIRDYRGANAAGDLVGSQIELVFRGQSCAGWPLMSSFDRWISRQHNHSELSKRISTIYSDLLGHFMANGRMMNMLPKEMDGFPVTSKEIAHLRELERGKFHQIQGYAQHRGLPTRLLDWSKSPYVAAFFAFCDSRKSESGFVSIWCLDINEMEHLFGNTDIAFIDEHVNYDQRQVWQRGVFTANSSNKLNMVDLFYAKTGRFHAEVRCPAIYQCKIPVGAASDALEDLAMMRINYMSVYPDEEGLIKESEERVRVAHSLNQGRT